MHDKQDFEGAVNTDEVITKTNYLAQYEKSLTPMYMKRYDEYQVVQVVAGKIQKNELTPSVYVLGGRQQMIKEMPKEQLRSLIKALNSFQQPFNFTNKGPTLHAWVKRKQP